MYLSGILLPLVLLGAGDKPMLRSTWDNARANQVIAEALPPRRVPFKAAAPKQVIVAKIVDDIGEFYPFTADFQRAAWDKAGYEAINGTTPETSVSALVGQLVARFNDSATMVLAEYEGVGDQIIPVLFEVERGAGGTIRVVVRGGGESFKPYSGKEVASIGGVPLADVLTRRLGPDPSPSRAAACLQAVMRREKAFRLQIAFSDGTSVDAPSTTASADGKGLWVEGGWRGTPLWELGTLKWADLAGVKEVDARLMPLMPEKPRALRNALTRLGEAATPHPTLKVYRHHNGRSDGSGSGYSSNFRADALENTPLASAHDVLINLPSWRPWHSLVGALAGWGLPGEPWPAAVSRVDLQDGFVLSLRTATYTAESPRAGWARTGTYAAGPSLTVAGAKALAAARILNYDHQFAFTPEGLQERLFQGVLEEYAKAPDVKTMLGNLGPYAQDAHLGLFDRFGVPGSSVFRPKNYLNGAGPLPPDRRKLPPFFLAVSPRGVVRVIWRLGKTTPVPVSAEILDIDGARIKDLVARAKASNSSPHECPVRLGWGVWKALPTKPSYRVTYRVGQGSAVVADVTDSGSPVDMLRKEPPAGLPAGWTFLGDTGQITIENLTARLQAGENFLIDGRFAGGSSVVSGNFWGAKEGPQRTALNVHMAAEEPVSWGAAESERWVMGISDKDLVHPPFSKPLKGVVVLTQTGLDQSWEESWRTYLRQYLGRNLITIGFPSAGITGAVSVLDLPVGGGSDHRLPHTPTGSWLTFGADTMNYKGVLLDQPLDFDEIFRAGTDDPFLAAVIKRIGGAEDAARARKRDN